MNTRNTALALLLSVGVLLPTSTTMASGTISSGYEPLRTQMDKINATITWDSDDQSALIKLKNGLSATVTVGEKSYRLAGKSGELSNAVQLVN